MSTVSRYPFKVAIAPWVGLVLIWALLGFLALPTLASVLDGSPAFVNPLSWMLDGAAWSPSMTLIVVVSLVAMLLLLAAVVAVNVWRWRRRTPTDSAAPFMAHGRQLRRLRRSKLAKLHRRLGLDPRRAPGVHLGYPVAHLFRRRALFGSYEDSYLIEAGPRRGKSRTLVVPNILLAPGATVVTSVRSDVVRDTIEHRAKLGNLWLFDPQGLAPEHRELAAWWNPNRGIETIEHAREQLANVFFAGTYGAAKEAGDTFWREGGENLLAAYIFAAAVNDLPITTVTEWLNRETDDEPVTLMRDKHPRVASDIAAMQGLVPQTRAGYYSQARGAMSFLNSEEMQRWVTPREDRPEFLPAEFAAASADTLYLLSKADGGAGPLIAALTKAVTSASEKVAERSASGRRDVPMLLVLDEVANICRLPELPAKYSTWGGYGIIPFAILQSREQGEGVWRQSGYAAMRNAASVYVFAGGGASDRSLREMSALIGEYSYDDYSRSQQVDGKASVTRSKRKEPILSVDDLGSLGENRAIVFPSSARPVLVRLIGWNKDGRLRRRLRRIEKLSQRVEPSTGAAPSVAAGTAADNNETKEEKVLSHD